MELLHESLYTLDTNLSLLEVYENINQIPSYLKLTYKNEMYTLTTYPNSLDQEDIESLADLISNKMQNKKLFGEIYDLIYDEESRLDLNFKH